MSWSTGPSMPPTSLGELAGDPLNGVADRDVQAAFGRATPDPPPDATPLRRAAKADRATIRRLLTEGELRRARIVGVRETHRSIAYGDSSSGGWDCPIWRLGLAVEASSSATGATSGSTPSSRW